MINHRNFGEAFAETPFAMTDTPDWVKGSRVPDVMFFTAERLAAYKAATPDWRSKPALIVPDLVVEIISPTDRFTEVEKKVTRYLVDGVRLVWIIDPEAQVVFVYQAGQKQRTRLAADDVLDDGEVIPGFTIRVAALFE